MVGAALGKEKNNANRECLRRQLKKPFAMHLRFICADLCGIFISGTIQYCALYCTQYTRVLKG